MKTCAVCGKDLPRPVDEFGDLREPVCMGCWFDGEPGETRYEIERLATEIELCNVEIAENQSTMFDSELEDLQEQIEMYKKKIQRLRDKINPDRAKVNSWIMGSPLIG